MNQRAPERDLEWRDYIITMHHVLDRVEAACAAEGLLEAVAPALPGGVPPAELLEAVRVVQQRMQAVLPRVEARRNDLVTTVQRISTTRRPPALQDHRVALGRALDCLG
jgi:hypothetical protein